MNNSAIAFLILSLAVWRITSLFVNESGPYDAFLKIRKAIGVYYDEYSVRQGKNVIAEAINCIWCFSIWVSAIAALFSPYTQDIVSYFENVLALSALTILLDRFVSKEGYG